MTDTEMIMQRLDSIERNTLIASKNVLTFEEAVTYTGISRGHLYRMTSEKRVPHYKLQRRLYFRKEELEDWMCRRKVMTVERAESLADTYIYLKGAVNTKQNKTQCPKR